MQGDVPKQDMVPILFILMARTVPHRPRQRASATRERIADAMARRHGVSSKRAILGGVQTIELRRCASP